MLFKAVTIQAIVALVTLLFLAMILILNSRMWFTSTFHEVGLAARVLQRLNKNLTLEAVPSAHFSLSIESTPSDKHLLQPKSNQSPDLTRLSKDNYTDHAGQVERTIEPLVATLEYPVSKPKNCHKSHCKEYLSPYELLSMRGCLQRTALRTVNGQLNLISLLIKENDCNFMDGTDRMPVALASTEGSGNTWIRGLLEKSTGICTGFLYCDYVMRREGFIGETIKSGSVLVIKTHTVTPQWYGVEYAHPIRDEPYYGSAVYILRNPYKALIAEWNRRATNGIIKKKHLPHNDSHTNVVPKEYWGIPKWDKFLHTYMEMWKLRLTNWVLNSTNEHPVHVVRYEDLKTDTAGEIANILTFLEIPHSYEDLVLRLSNDFTTFKRRHTDDNFEHYSSNQKQYIKSVILDTIKLAEAAKKMKLLNLEEYLRE